MSDERAGNLDVLLGAIRDALIIILRALDRYLGREQTIPERRR